MKDEKDLLHSEEQKGILAWVIQFVKFGIVGVSNTLISLAVYYIFVWINPDFYMWGNVVGWVVSVANAFYWNNKYVFQAIEDNWQNTLRRLLKTYLSYGGTFLLSTVLLYFEVNFWDVSTWLAPVINLLITIPLNFILNKLWAFK